MKAINPVFRTFVGIFLICFFANLLLSSCEKNELPIPKHDAGSVVTSSVSMESNYKYQVYFDLKTNTVVGQNLKTSWDMGFEATSNGYRIILNESKAMYAFNTGTSDFESVTDTTGFAAGKKWDASSGNLDSTAIGDWRINHAVYIIDRGYSETGTHQGFRKIKIVASGEDSYTVHFAQLNGAGETTLEITKDSTYNFAFLSFATSGVVMVEPPKADWDLVFTQYIHVFYEPELTVYLVTGCLLNRSETRSACDAQTPFSDIHFTSVPGYSFTTTCNAIGYDWKEFDGTQYIIHPEKNYIIQDREGYYYKLHFIDFYNDQGVKGYPKFEFQQL